MYTQLLWTVKIVIVYLFNQLPHKSPQWLHDCCSTAAALTPLLHKISRFRLVNSFSKLYLAAAYLISIYSKPRPNLNVSDSTFFLFDLVFILHWHNVFHHKFKCPDQPCVKQKMLARVLNFSHILESLVFRHSFLAHLIPSRRLRWAIVIGLVHRPSARPSVRKLFLKRNLLLNNWSKFHITSHGCSPWCSLLR